MLGRGDQTVTRETGHSPRYAIMGVKGEYSPQDETNHSDLRVSKNWVPSRGNVAVNGSKHAQ